jgi:para-aminobenzoate synthetase/4-amino-4-deoxychorismate lyase
MRRVASVELDLPEALGPLDALRALREQPRLVALFGDWHRAGFVVGYSPVRVLEAGEDPFAAVAALGRPARRPVKTSDGQLGGGWIGYWGYQLGRLLERLPEPPPRPMPCPDAQLAYYDHLLRYDPTTRRWFVEGVAALTDDELSERAEHTRDLLAGSGVDQCGPHPYELEAFESIPSMEEHIEAVAGTIAHVEAGDIFQANICRRLESTFHGDPLDVFCAGYERLRPRFGAFLRTSVGAVVSFSPELFLRRNGDAVLTSPIKGTMPLNAGHDLASSVKDRAENVMIVDLMRNDLGRVCVPGTVRVERLYRAEAHTGVRHLISDVSGRLRPEVDDADLLRATFPPGSVTGAPKVRAMEIIDELETTGREVYTGAIGYVAAGSPGFPGDGLALSVAIRTFEFSGDRVWLGVGGGIVAESTPAAEGIETTVKAAPLLAAIGASVAEARTREAARSKDSAGSRKPTLGLGPALTVEVPDRSAGLFETMLVIDGQVLDLEAHLARLWTSAKQCFGDALPADLADRVEAYAVSLLGRHRLRLDIRPHDADVRITTEPAGDPVTRPWRLVPRVVAGGLGAHKWRDRRLLTAIEPAPETWGADCDALLVDTDGGVLETGRGNIFVVNDHDAVTPALDGRILPGTTRAKVIGYLERSGIEVRQVRMRVEDVADAYEVFVSSSISRIRAVGSCDGVGNWPLGPMTRWLSREARGLDEPTPPGRAAADPGHEFSRWLPKPASLLRIVLIDNYDSFVYNLDQYLRELGVTTSVVRNDVVAVADLQREAEAGRVDGVIISPGPGRPGDAGVSNDLVRGLAPHLPILGVCLGHQCIAEVFGASVVRANVVVHGKASLVYHEGEGVFAGLAGPLTAGRYHSLVVNPDRVPPSLAVTARTAGGEMMGLRHRTYPVEGVQFHPESILTHDGHRILANFLRSCVAKRESTRVPGGFA